MQEPTILEVAEAFKLFAETVAFAKEKELLHPKTLAHLDKLALTFLIKAQGCLNKAEFCSDPVTKTEQPAASPMATANPSPEPVKPVDLQP